MPTDFQWITDHDDWSPLVPEPAGPGRRRLPGGRALLLVILALLVGTGLVAGQVDRALQILADRQVADVLGVYTLLLRAEQQQDLELFVSILSARSPNWAQVQKELFSLGWLTASPQLGLEPASDRTVPRPEPAAVSLSADMAAAELTVVRPYHFPAGDGELETVALRHTLVFRRGDDRWLLAPPMPEFWGEWREEDWGGLHVVFPARDTHLVQRLTVDLAGLLAGLCRDLACPDSLSLQLRFDRDPAVFLAMRDWPAYLQTGPFINLPAPGLIGEPVDELAYQALLRLYAGLALPAAMARLTGEPCCGSGLLSQAISERYLVALGLRPETLDAGAYRDFLNAPLALQELEALWRAPAEFRHDDQRWPVALMLVDYAAGYPSGLRGPAATVRRPAATVRRPGATIRRPGATIRRPAAVIQVFAALNQASSLAGWLAQSTGRPASGLATLTEWLLYVESQAKPAGVTAPLPLPPQHIGLICHAETGAGRSTHVFYRLDPATGGLETEAVFDQYVQAFALNQGQAVIIQESRGRPSMGRTLLWRDGSVITVADSRQGDTLVFVADWLFPSDRRIPLVVQTARRRADLEPLAGAILDLDHCTADSCPLRQVAGYPDFSPDGRWILL